MDQSKHEQTNEKGVTGWGLLHNGQQCVAPCSEQKGFQRVGLVASSSDGPFSLTGTQSWGWCALCLLAFVVMTTQGNGN